MVIFGNFIKITTKISANAERTRSNANNYADFIFKCKSGYMIISSTIFN